MSAQDGVRQRIKELRAEGLSLAAVADELNVLGISTPSGHGRWWAASVRAFLDPEGHALRMREYRARRRA